MACGSASASAPSSSLIDANTTHGMSGTPIWRSWWKMLRRSSGQVPGYEHVGRDPKWDSFEGFLDSMGDTWFEGAVLCRSEDTGDYEPGNCRWDTPSANSVERANRSKHLLPDGRYGIDVAREHGINDNTYRKRIHLGWQPERAATEPTRAAR